MTFSMLVGKKRILLYGIPALIFVIAIAFLLFPAQLKLFYVLDEVHRARVEPTGTWVNMTCPECGRQLERIVIDPDNPLMADDAWRYAYYCGQEDIFWVADCAGWYFVGWYGPFNAFWKLTNTTAISIVIISGVTLVLLGVSHKGSMKRARAIKILRTPGKFELSHR